MAETSVIREFLVALGYKNDEGGLKKFEQGIDKATKSVVTLATAVAATALAVTAGVTKIASNLEALYFSSIKSNSTATNLKAIDRAAQNLGTEAGEAMQSVQGLARFLRTNPGGEGLLASLGVQTRDANGQLRDTTGLMLDLADSLRGKEYYLANQYAGMFGISEDMLRAMRSGKFADEVRAMRLEMANTGFDQAAKDAHRFMMGLRDLVTQLEAFGIQVYDALTKKLGGGVDALTEWLRVNGPLLAMRTADILLKILELVERIAPAIVWLVDKFIEWDKATDGWSTKLLGLVAVLKVFGGLSIIGGVLSLVGAFVSLGAAIAGASAAGSASGLIGLAGRLGVIGAAAYGLYELYKATSVKPEDHGTGKTTPWAQRIEDWMHGLMPKKDRVLFELQKSGYTREQAIGVLANLQAESGLNERAVGDHGAAYGIAQWHPDRQGLFKRWAGVDIHGSTFAQQLGFLLHELGTNEKRAAAMLRATRNAEQAGQVFSRYYERPAAIEREAARRGEAAVHLAQDTKIYVQGGDSPGATGRAVADEQNRVNAQLTRNLAAAVQ